VTVEAMTGYHATVEGAATVGGAVFHDREYEFTNLGSFSGHTFIKIYNNDKDTHETHVQMKLRLQRPTTLFVSKLSDDHLEWLQADGWTLTHLEGVSYSGTSRETKTTDWLTRSAWSIEDQAWHNQGVLAEEDYGPGEVWQKTFTSGVVEMRGDGGGAGSYVMFASHPDNQPRPREHLPGFAEYVGCYRDDPQRDLGASDPSPTHAWHNAETNTFELCRERCGDSRYMSLQWGGECFCADAYSTEDKYMKVPDDECMTQEPSLKEPCAPNSYACGGDWANAVYEINPPTLPGSQNYIGCFVDDGDRDMGDMRGTNNDARTNTFETCRNECIYRQDTGTHYMALQYGGECFCSNYYSTAAKYHQVDDSECDAMNNEPCKSNSHLCGGSWRQAVYRVNYDY